MINLNSIIRDLDEKNINRIVAGNNGKGKGAFNGNCSSESLDSVSSVSSVSSESSVSSVSAVGTF